MRRLVLVFAILLSVSIASAKGPKFLGSWMSEKIIAKGSAHQMFMPITFEDDNDMIAEDMVFGIWRYNKKTKLINITSFLSSKFNGDWEIKELSKEKLILKKGDFEWHLFKYDKKAVAATNAQFGLSGLWKLESKTALGTSESSEAAEEATEEAVEEVSEGAVEEEGSQGESYEEEFEIMEELPNLYFSFEAIDYSLKEIGDGYSSNLKGSWMYKPKQNTILFIAGRRSEISGDAKIIEHNENILSFENNGFNYVFKKLEVVDVEVLDFGEYYLFNKQNQDNSLPWVDFEKLKEQATSMKMLIYKHGVYNSTVKVFEYDTIKYSTSYDQEEDRVVYKLSNLADTKSEEAEEISVSADYATDDAPDTKFFPRTSLSIYIVQGKEQITTPAGTFDCTVIIGMDDYEYKYKLWMINTKPGVYAKIIVQYKDDFRKSLEYSEYVLQGIE
jgi:hypothetical protein